MFKNLSKLALALGFASISSIAAAVPSCDTADAAAAARQAAVARAYSNVDAVRQATAGTANDGYAQAEQQRQANQRCMFDASNAMGNIVMSGGDLSGLVNQLSNMLTSPDSGCQVTADGIAQAAKARATAYAQQQAQQAVGQAAGQAAQQAETAASKAINGALPAPISGGQYNLNSMTQQMTQKQAQDAWNQLSQSLSNVPVN